MAYRLRVQANLDWVGPGQGPMDTLVAPMLPGGGAGAQTLNIRSSTGGAVIQGTAAGPTPPAGALLSADITNLVNAMAADVSAQLNAAIATPQGWVTGQP